MLFAWQTTSYALHLCSGIFSARDLIILIIAVLGYAPSFWPVVFTYSKFNSYKVKMPQSDSFSPLKITVLASGCCIQHIAERTALLACLYMNCIFSRFMTYGMLQPQNEISSSSRATANTGALALT